MRYEAAIRLTFFCTCAVPSAKKEVSSLAPFLPRHLSLARGERDSPPIQGQEQKTVPCFVELWNLPLPLHLGLISWYWTAVYFLLSLGFCTCYCFCLERLSLLRYGRCIQEGTWAQWILYNKRCFVQVIVNPEVVFFLYPVPSKPGCIKLLSAVQRERSEQRTKSHLGNY